MPPTLCVPHRGLGRRHGRSCGASDSSAGSWGRATVTCVRRGQNMGGVGRRRRVRPRDDHPVIVGRPYDRCGWVGRLGHRGDAHHVVIRRAREVRGSVERFDVLQHTRGARAKARILGKECIIRACRGQHVGDDRLGTDISLRHQVLRPGSLDVMPACRWASRLMSATACSLTCGGRPSSLPLPVMRTG